MNLDHPDHHRDLCYQAHPSCHFFLLFLDLPRRQGHPLDPVARLHHLFLGVLVHPVHPVVQSVPGFRSSLCLLFRRLVPCPPVVLSVPVLPEVQGHPFFLECHPVHGVPFLPEYQAVLGLPSFRGDLPVLDSQRYRDLRVRRFLPLDQAVREFHECQWYHCHHLVLQHQEDLGVLDFREAQGFPVLHFGH